MFEAMHFLLVCWDLSFTRWDSLYLKNNLKMLFM